MSATIDQILAAPDPRAEARAYVDRLLRLELRGHGWLFEMDRLFADAHGPVNLFAQPSYRKLLAAHPLVDGMEEKITRFYLAARKLAAADASAPEETARRDRAAAVVDGVRDSLRRAREDAGERVLLSHLMARLRGAEGDEPGFGAAPFEDALFVPAEDSTDRIRQMLDALPPTDDVVEEVEQGEHELALELDDEGRGPNSLSVYPTAGPNGNIDGFTFPRGTWAVTFDDGPNPEITPKDLANLKAAGTKATFFWLAKNLARYPDVIKSVQAAGMPVENHSWTHAILNKPSDLARLHTTVDKEIVQSTAADTKAYGVKPRFFRCPYGAGFQDAKIRGLIARLGMIHVRWNVDSLDWKDPNPASVQARVEKQMAANGRGIILFHDIHRPALTVVPRLLAKTKGKVRWVTIPQIVDELNGKR
jgi:peptidoglycan/xylan/chitin deacetylase (PgdA/CDA1 family)